MYKILIVEDEVLIAKTVAEYLKHEGHSVTHVTNIAASMDSVNSETDLVLLDLMLPDGNGEDLCEYIVGNYRIPVIMLTSKKTEQSKINGFACGADDYLTKPFSPRELTARVKAVLRRSKNDSECLSFESGLVVDFATRLVFKNNQEIKLTPNEFTILHCIASNSNKIVTREMLIENIKSIDSADRTIDVHVAHLRKKIEDDPKKPSIIKTVHGIGYKLGEKIIEKKR